MNFSKMKILFMLMFYLLPHMCKGAELTSKINEENLTENVWVRVSLPWQEPPPDIGLKQRTAGVTILRFYPDHSFVKLQCRVIEQNRTWVISDGSNRRAYAGKWKINELKVDVQYKLLSEEIKRVNSQMPSQISTVVYQLGEDLLVDGEKFEKTFELEKAEFESHSAVVDRVN